MAAELSATRQQLPVCTVNCTRHGFAPCARLTDVNFATHLHVIYLMVCKGVQWEMNVVKNGRGSWAVTGHLKGLGVKRYPHRYGTQRADRVQGEEVRNCFY